METKPFENQAPPEMLRCQTWVLKVCIDCEGCRKKVKKVLQAIEGVYTTTVDAQQHKVVVTGNVGAETLIKKLAKSGKHAELWPENIVKMNENPKNNKKQNKSKDVNDHRQGDDNKGIENKPAEKPENALKDGEKATANTGENDLPAMAGDAGGETHEIGGGTGDKKKKEKKKQGQKGDFGNARNDNDATDGPAGTGSPLPEVATPEPVPPSPSKDLNRSNQPAYQYPTAYNYVPPELCMSYSTAPYANSAAAYYAAPMHAPSYAYPVMTIPPYDPFRVPNYGYDDHDYDDDKRCSIM